MTKTEAKGGTRNFTYGFHLQQTGIVVPWRRRSAWAVRKIADRKNYVYVPFVPCWP